ncbi:MAG TPA: CARDB domain-containing protein [Mycobacteriales bacterium]|nr:CARDB domain-containing protein [Mycobacteriales bacterium]
MKSRRTARPSHRRRPDLRSPLLLGLVLLLLATVPVLVPLVVTRGGDTPVAAPPGLAAAPGVPALPRAGAGAEPDTVAAVAPPPPAGTLIGTPSPTAAPRTTPPPPPPSAPAPAPTTPATTAPSPPAPPAPLTAEPDLVVVSVAWSPEAVAAGQPVTFTAVVRNAGTEPTPDVTHGVGFTVDGTPVSWSAAGSAPLAPGEERIYTADGGPAGATWTAVPGEHSLEAYVDDAERIGETDDTNNALTATLTVP